MLRPRLRVTHFLVPSLVALVGWRAALCLAATPGLPPVQLAPEVVTASRTPQPAEHTAATVRTFDWETLKDVPAITLDGQLRTLPGFSLFRRSDSLIANPTAQGVSLRGLGPSGASRSLVLLDGVPLNDPFGGWVAWTKVPREQLERVELVPGGGATAWGNAALGGVVQLLGRSGSAQATRATLMGGEHATRSFEFAHTQPARNARLDLSARIFATDGFPLVAPERRGPIDIAAWSRHRWAQARWRQPVGANLEAAFSVRGYEEKRGNGTPYQQNESREEFASVALGGQPAPGFAWQGVLYGQDQSFASTFSAVNATRTAETPASDQFDVPAEALGAAWTGTWLHDTTGRTSVGGDARHVRGETREHFTFAAGNFTRLRVAGGRQRLLGLFSLHERSLGAAWRGTIGARLDSWTETHGRRQESDRTSGALLRDDRYPDRDGIEFSPSAGLVWQPNASWRWRTNVQRAFRRPTLNELYRPFRVGPNVTEANAALGTESVLSAEIGSEWRAPWATNRDRAPVFGVTAFWNDLRDAVGNVTIARGPGTFPIVGFIAAGGVGRQRLNLDRTRVRGIELSVHWSPRPDLRLSADWMYNDARVRQAAVAPALAGNRVAQVPRQSASLSGVWAAPGGLRVAPRVRGIGRQYEDDENQLILGAVVVGDLSISRSITRHLELFVTAENIGDARVETGRTADGLVNVGTPRLIIGGLRGNW